MPYIVVGVVLGVILMWLYNRQKARSSYIKEKTTEKTTKEETKSKNTVKEENEDEAPSDSIEETD